MTLRGFNYIANNQNVIANICLGLFCRISLGILLFRNTLFHERCAFFSVTVIRTDEEDGTAFGLLNQIDERMVSVELGYIGAVSVARC